MEDKYQFAQSIVREAGAYLRQHLDDDLDIEEKEGPTDLVTHLDKAVQQLLTDRISQAYPTDSICGEESAQQQPVTVGKVWVIDPIDGTSNFVVQRTDFAVLLAYLEDGVGQFGLIYDVMNDKLYHGGQAFGVFENERKLPPASQEPLQKGMMGINQGLYAQNPGGIRQLAKQMVGLRCIGSAGLSFAHVLTQRYKAYFSYIYPWDYLAGMILGEALGYVLVTIEGQAPRLSGREMVLMVAAHHLKEVKEMLADGVATSIY